MADLWAEFDSKTPAVKPTASADLWAEFDTPAAVTTSAAPNARLGEADWFDLGTSGGVVLNTGGVEHYIPAGDGRAAALAQAASRPITDLGGVTAELPAMPGVVGGSSTVASGTPSGSMLGDIAGALLHPIDSLQGFGAPIARGIAGADMGSALQRGSTSLLASGLHTGADFVDQTVQAPLRGISDALGVTGFDAIRDPLGAQALAAESLGVNKEIGLDRQAAMAGLERPGLGDLIANPGASLERLGERYTTMGVESAPAMALAVATRNPQLASGLLGATTGAQEFTDLRGQGIDRGAAAQAGTLSALVEAAFEGYSLPKVMGKASAGSLGGAAIAEGAQEFPVSIAQQNINDQATGNKTPILQQILDGLDAAVIGGGMGGSAHIGSNLPSYLSRGATAPTAAAPAEALPTNAIASTPPELAQGLGDIGSAAAPAQAVAAPATDLAPEDTADIEALLLRNLPEIRQALGLADVEASTEPADLSKSEKVDEIAPESADPDARFRRPAPESAPAAPSAIAAEPTRSSLPVQTSMPKLGDDTTAPAVQVPPTQSAPALGGADLAPADAPSVQTVTPPSQVTAAPAATRLGEDAPATAPTDRKQRGDYAWSQVARYERELAEALSVPKRKQDASAIKTLRDRLDMWQDDASGFEKPAAPAAPKKPRKRAVKTDKAGKPLDLLRVIAASGGLNREAFRAQGVDPAEFTRRAGFNYVFRKDGGMRLSDLREMMQQEGYLPRDPEGGVAKVDDNDALDVFDRAFRGGEDIFSDDQGPAVAAYRAAKREADEAFQAEWTNEARQEAELSDIDDFDAFMASDNLPEYAAETNRLTERAYDLGATDAQIIAAGFDVETADTHLANLQAIIEELDRADTDPAAAEGAGSRVEPGRVEPRQEAEPASGLGDFALEAPAKPAAQEVAPTPSAGLFGAPSTRDFTDAAARARDAKRDGKDAAGRTDMLAGDGELFAGKRPEQARVEEVNPTKPKANPINEGDTVDILRGPFKGLTGKVSGAFGNGLNNVIVDDPRRGGVHRIHADALQAAESTPELKASALGSNSADGGVAGTEALTDSAKRQTLSTELDGLDGDLVVDDGRELRSESATLERAKDGVLSDSERVRDLLVSEPFRLKGLGGLDAPSQRMVLDHVVRATQDLKVLDAVVELLPVDMVNVLRREKLSPEDLFHDRAMLQDYLAADRDGSVATAVDVANALSVAMTGGIAENPAGISGRVLRQPGEGTAAVGANVGDSFQGSSVTRTTQKSDDGNEPGAEYSRAQGDSDASENGLRDALVKVLGDQASRVEYLHGTAGLPARLRNGVESRTQQRGGVGKTAALYDPATQRVYLFTDVVTNPDRAAFHAAHEIAGHDGLRKLLGKDLDKALTLALQNPTVKALADEMTKQRKLRPDQSLLAAEEALAELAAAVRTGNFEHITDRYGVQVPEGIRARLTAAIANFLKRLKALFDQRGVTFKDSQVRELLEAAWQAVDGRGATQGEAVASTVQDQTETPAFRKWFGDSKVVDAGGSPLRMYHGTSSSGFDAFDTYASNYGLVGQGGYFTDNPDVASSYTKKGRGTQPGVYQTFLSIKNPLDIDAPADPAKWRAAFDGVEDFHEGGDTNESWYRAAEEMLADQELPRWEGAEIMQDSIRNMGHDGITHMGGGRVDSDGVRHRVYVAFDPEQIKSATANSGAFDAANPSILESVTSDDTKRPRAGPRLAADDVRRADKREGVNLGIIERAKQDVADQLAGFRKLGKGRPKNQRSLARRADAVRGYLFDSVVSRARGIESRNPQSKAIRTLFNQVVTAPGDSRLVAETLNESAEKRFAQFTNRVRNVLANEGMDRLSDTQNDHLRRTLLGTQTNAPTAIQRAATRIRKLMDVAREDLIAAGVEVGLVDDVGYLTRLYDDARILSDEAGFLKAAATYYRGEGFGKEVGATARDTFYGEGNLVRFLSHANRAASSNGDVAEALLAIREAVKRYRVSSNTHDDAGKVRKLVDSIRDQVAASYAENSASAWLHKIKTPTVSDVFNGVGPSGAPLTKERELGGTADTIMAGYLNTSVLDVLDSYARTTAKKIAMAERFGPKGERVQALLDAASLQGVPKADLDEATELMESALGGYNPINPSMKSSMDALQAVTYLALLARVVFSSAAESITFAIRTGNMTHAIAPLIQVYRAALKTEHGKGLNDMALAIGLNGNKAMDEVMQNQLGGDYGMEPKWSGLVHRFMHATLLTPLTRAQRAYGVGAATGYLRWLAGHVAGGTRVKEMAVYLNELGIADHEAFSQWMLAQGALPEATELHDANGRPTPRGQDYMTAVRRMTDQTIQNPNASHRPVWMNNPYGRVLGSIMGFSYASYENILKREANLSRTLVQEVGKGAGSRRMAAALGGMVALAMGQVIVSTIRELLFNAARFEDKDDEEIAKEMVALGISRTFGIGSADPIIQYLTGLKYSRTFAETMLGASLGSLAELIDAAGDVIGARNSPNTDTAEYRLMEQIYSKVITPAANAVLSRLPFGIGTAGILAVSDKRQRERFAGLFFEAPERESALDRKYQKASKDLETLTETAKDRLALKPRDQWAGELATLKAEFAPLLDDVTLDVYVRGGKHGGPGDPKVGEDGTPKFKRGDGPSAVNRFATADRRIAILSKSIKLIGDAGDVKDGLTRGVLRMNTATLATMDADKLAEWLPTVADLHQRKGDDDMPVGRDTEREVLKELQALRRHEKREALESPAGG